MKKQRLLITFALFICLAVSFIKPGGDILLQGVIRNEAGYLIEKIELVVYKDAVFICEGKSDKYGNYSITLPEEGIYHVFVGKNNSNYYTITDTNLQILPLKIFRKDFTLMINKQELQHKTTRLKEAYQHLKKNESNIYYKGIYFSRFPRSMDEMLLFFSPKVPYFNLKKEADDVVTKFVDTKMVSDTAYFTRYANICLGWIEQTDIKCYKYYSSRMNGMIYKNPDGFFDVLHFYNNNEIKIIFTQVLKDFTQEQLNTSFEKLKVYNPRIFSIYKETAGELNIK